MRVEKCLLSSCIRTREEDYSLSDSTTSEYATAYVTRITRCEVDHEAFNAVVSVIGMLTGMKCTRTGR